MSTYAVKHLDIICTTLVQRRRRWADVVTTVIQMFCVCWVISANQCQVRLAHASQCIGWFPLIIIYIHSNSEPFPKGIYLYTG